MKNQNNSGLTDPTAQSSRPRIEMKSREDYKSEKGIAAWWPKDGGWHIALPAVNRFGQMDMLWTYDQYPSRESAIAAIEQSAASNLNTQAPNTANLTQNKVSNPGK